MASDAPILVLSQDYELFFHRSGTAEKCLFEPCDLLLEVASRTGLRITFLIDAGMIMCMDQHAKSKPELARRCSNIKKHISSLAAAGHEIALHIHPHWQDTRWTAEGWDFSDTRYSLAGFSDDEILHIFESYSDCLANLAGARPVTYRAGGFCVEPFDRLKPAMRKVGINVDSSVVPGAYLEDPDKGFDYRGTPAEEWWYFDRSPTLCSDAGEFLEIPIGTQQLPVFYYWRRVASRVLRSHAGGGLGDGVSKRIGKIEIARRLAGISRTAELSIDDSKADYLLADMEMHRGRTLVQLMGHPKLLSLHSLGILQQYIERMGIRRFETLASAAMLIRDGEITKRE